MIGLVTQLIVRCASVIAAKPLRARWKEEWLAELAAAASETASFRVRHALGAVRDALDTRRPAVPMTGADRSGILTGLHGDILHALRALRRRPGHTAAVIACLGIGLIVSVATFSVLSSVLYGRRIGVADQDSLRRVYLAYRDRDGRPETGNELTLGDYDVLRGDARTAGLIAAEGKMRMTASADNGPVAISGAFASGNFFSVIGTVPVAGRLLASVDDEPDAPPTVVVGEHFWRAELGGRPDAIGQTILLGGREFNVVGVAPARFHGISGDVDPMQDDSHGAQVWVPLHFAKGWLGRPASQELWVEGLLRLPRGSTEASIANLLTVPAARIGAVNPAGRSEVRFQMSSLGVPPDVSLWEFMLLLGAVMSVPIGILAIGCANVANLQLARAAERARELAVRTSLGASRGQLIRLLTVEIGVQAAVAVVFCALVTVAILKSIAWMFPQPVAVDWRASVLAGGLLLLVLVTAGLAPAWIVMRRAGASGLRQNDRSGGLGHSRLRNALVVLQVGLSLAMLSTSTLFTRTVTAMDGSVPPVLRTQMAATIDTSQIGMTPAAARRFAGTVLDALEADARVQHAALYMQDDIRYRAIDAANPSDRSARDAVLMQITPDWLDMMRVPTLTGRALAAGDGVDIALVSAHLADQIAPNASPLGQVLEFPDMAGGPDRRVRIVGVVADHDTAPDTDRPFPVVYTPLDTPLRGSFSLRFSSPMREAVAADLRTTIRRLEPRLPWLVLQSGEDEYLRNAGPILYVALGIGAGGVLALILAAGGLYAVLAYVVQLRRREIGVRLAIGANPLQIVGMILRQTVGLILAGSAAGVIIAVPVGLLFRANAPMMSSAVDPVVFLAPMAALALAGLVAAAVPAQRAARIDPVKAIRED